MSFSNKPLWTNQWNHGWVIGVPIFGIVYTNLYIYKNYIYIYTHLYKLLDTYCPDKGIYMYFPIIFQQPTATFSLGGPRTSHLYVVARCVYSRDGSGYRHTSGVPRWFSGGFSSYPKDPFVCPKKEIVSTILFWGWDLDDQSYSRERSGFLGI